MVISKRIKIIIASIIFIEIGVFLYGLIFVNKGKILGTSTIISQIKQEDIIFASNSAGLKYFYEPKPNTTRKDPVSWLSYTPIYTINADGMNQLSNIEITKPPNTYRILTIGDSFTFGLRVNTKDNYPSQLNTMLSKKCDSNFQILNLGVDGYDIQYTVERFKLRGQKYNSDLVIWYLVPDDFRRIAELFLPRSRMYAKEAMKKGEYQEQIINGEFSASWGKAKSEIIEELGGEKKVLQLQKSYMEHINSFYSGKLAIFTPTNMPDEYKQVIRNFSSKRNNTFYYDQIPNIHTIEGASFPDFHPTEAGHTVIAKGIMDYLIDKNLLPCSFK